MENTKGVLLEYIDSRIDDLDLEDPGIPECTSTSIQDLADRYIDKWKELANGAVPASIPSLEELTLECRTAIFNLAYPRLVGDSSLDERTRNGLNQSRAKIEQEFIAGNTHGVLKEAARPLATPLMDDAIEKVREDLDEQDRFDIIAQIADWNDDITEAELRSDIESAQDWVGRGERFGPAVTMIVSVAAAVLMGLIWFPSLTNGLRWSGLSLAVTGAVYFAVGKVLESRLPDQLAELVEQDAEEADALVPPSVNILGSDLLISLGKGITEGFAQPSLTLMIVGAIIFGASFLVIFVGPFIPFVR